MMRLTKHVLFGSFRSRLLLVFIFAVTPAIGLIIYNTLDARAERARAAEREAVLVARFAAGEQQRGIEDARSLLRSMSLHPAVQGNDVAACEDYLRSELAMRPAYTVLGVTNATGERICNSIPDSPASDPSNQVWFQRVHESRGFAVGDYQLGRLTGQLVFVTAYPTLNDAGEVQRIIAAALSLEWLNNITALTGLPPDSSIVVLDSAGTVLARHPADEASLGQSFADDPQVQAALAGESGVSSGQGLDGVGRIYGFVPFGSPSGGSIVIRVGIPESVVFANVDAFFVRNIAGLGLITLIALGVVLYGSERLVLHSVRSLQRATQQVAAGDLSARSGIAHSTNEIGELARGFDSMATALEKRDEERTTMEVQREELVREHAARSAAEQSERFTMAQYQVGLMLLDAQELADAVPGILRAIGENLDFDGVALWMQDGADFRCTAVWRAEGSLVPHDALVGSTHLPVHLLGEGQGNAAWTPAIVTISADSAWDRYRSTAADGAQSAILMPIRSGGRLVAVLEVLSQRPMSLESPSLRPLGTIVGNVRQFLRRQEIADVLRLSEARLAGIIDSAMDGIISINNEQRIVLFNNAAERMFGYSKEEMDGQPLDRLLPKHLRENHPGHITEFGRTGTTTRVMGGTVPLAARRRDGTVFPIEATISQIEVASERYFTVIVRDVTERLRAQEQMASSLREKEVLLREIHHRVKNNLQVVSSLLNLQAERAANTDVMRALEDSRSRVRSMALVHDRLYSSEKFDQIDFNQYLGALVPELIRLYRQDEGSIKMAIDAEGVHLDLAVAIPLALITNELVTNALKYAFPGGESGTIRIRARAPAGQEHAMLTVADDGIGLQAEVRDGQTSLGLQLVSSLARQIGCSVQWGSEQGTTVHIVERAEGGE